MKFRKPMSAHNFEGNEHRVTYPCFAQPKLDGVRCVTDGRRFWSRDGNRFPDKNIAHLKLGLALRHLVDGELMIPNAPFEETVSALKHASSEDRSAARMLRFYVFDVMTPGPFRQRDREVVEVVNGAHDWDEALWIRVRTTRLTNRKALEGYARVMLQKGHEGTMIRNSAGLYVLKRTHDLLKWKPLLDKEFKVTGVKEAKGKDAGTPVFVCRIGQHEFCVRPKGSMALRRRMWKDRKKLIGQMLTVEYQNLTKLGVPRFPRGKSFRNYE